MQDVLRPLELVFIRHGESEANVAYQNSKERGGGYPIDIRNKPNSEMELTSRGIEQAQAAGNWIKKHINAGRFAQYYVSSFKRAQHTAAYLDLPDARTKQVWKIRDYLREQEYGYYDGLTPAEMKEKYPDIVASKEKDKVYWQRPGGESLANLVFRTKIGIIETLYREAVSDNGVVVAHGHVLWAVRIVMEGMTYDVYENLNNPNNQLEKINNGQVIQYTRINPSNPNDIANNFRWMRSVCPWDTSKSNNDWRIIERPKYSNNDLLTR